jgi:hypothetical protein
MRLTTRSPKNNCAYLVKVKSDEQAVDSEYPNTLRCIIECFEKLAKYEDTGIEPEQIEALQQQIAPLQGEAVLMVGDMPESCSKCKLRITDTFNCSDYYCLATFKSIAERHFTKKRHPDCPLFVVGGGADA